MSKEAESADLIMKLYDLRREATMRDARNWFISFFPENVEDIRHTMVDPQTSGYYRMVTTYWDMAAGFVNRGAIDEEMFLDSNGECWVIFAKIQPYLDGIRKILDNPTYLHNLEKLLMKQPEALQKCESRRESMRRWMAARAEMMAKSAS
ncbi:MAG TPA: hypothetical protein VEV84_09205 [Pyrinomonadaceae bacterium]|jgi:hypothetical protein|nr:hypothetical protein [Pyrinomonadaceae bacterium]